MAAIDQALATNESFSRRFRDGDLAAAPAKKLAVVACMDARVDVEPILGLEPGDAHIIRNAGGIATEDALRSLIISQQLLGTREVMIINHTDCGMMKFRDVELRNNLRGQTGVDSSVPAGFLAFNDLHENVRQQIDRVRAHPWIDRSSVVRGFIYDVQTGRLQEVDAPVERTEAA